MKMKKHNLVLFLCLAAGSVLLLWALDMLYAPKLTEQEYSLTLSDQGIAVLPDVIVTNNTQITVSTAQGQPPVIVHLYDTQYANPIMEIHLKSGGKDSFKNLTAARSYQLGVQSTEPGETHVKLKTAYLP